MKYSFDKPAANGPSETANAAIICVTKKNRLLEKYSLNYGNFCVGLVQV